MSKSFEIQAPLRLGTLLGAAPLVLALAMGPAWAGTTPKQRPNPQSQGSAWAAYRIGPGDLLELVVLDPAARDLGGQVEVLNDGSISLPLLGSVVVDGLTTAEASRWLSQLYRKTLLRPELTVRVLRPRPIQVSVVGEVESPGLYSLTSSELSAINGGGATNINGLPTLVTAIQKAGGITLNADLTQVILRRRISRSKTDVSEQPLNVLQLLQQGDQSQNPYLFDGDSIVIARAPAPIDQAIELAAANLSPKQISVNVVGEVVTPGRLELKANTPVMEAILAAGGPKTWRAKRNNIELVRLNRNNTVTHQWFRLDYGQRLNALSNPPLKDGDTLIVHRSNYAVTTDAIAAISDPLTGLVNIWALVNLINNPNR